MRTFRDILAIVFDALAEIFERLAAACAKNPEEEISIEMNTNGHVKAGLSESEGSNG